jgi:hypothetical protein
MLQKVHLPISKFILLVLWLSFNSIEGHGQKNFDLQDYVLIKQILVQNESLLPTRESYMGYGSLYMYKDNYERDFQKLPEGDKHKLLILLSQNKIVGIYYNSSKCIRIMQKRRWCFGFWWKQRSLLYYEGEKPCSFSSIGLHIKKYESIDKNWIYIDVLDHIGPPS